VQLTSPETMSTYAGFSPRPEPRLIATYKTKGEALAVSKGLDRDRAVDESGNQIAVFGRRGARPFTFAEIQRTLRTDEGRGDYFSVTDEPASEPRNPKTTVGTLGIFPVVFVAGLLLGVSVVFTGYDRRRRAALPRK
jgi:hypothetical protein